MYSVSLATLDEDYTAPPAILQATPSTHGPDSDLCFEVPIVDDDIVESEECFALSISLIDAEALMVSIAEDEDTALCCIQDNDSELFIIAMSERVLKSSPGFFLLATRNFLP